MPYQSSLNPLPGSDDSSSNVKANIRKFAHPIGGGFGAIIGAIVTSPLEVVKTRLQARSNRQSLDQKFSYGTGTFKAIRSLAREEGIIRGLYRGLPVQIAGVVPARMMHFFLYGNIKDSISPKFEKESLLPPAIASLLGAATVLTLLQPVWLVKTRLQLQTVKQENTLYKNAWDVVVRTLRDEGAKGLYKGLSASYLGLSETVIQFTLYELLKQKSRQYKSLKAQSSAPITESFQPLPSSPSLFELFSLSCISKLVASFLTYPHEVVRTRLREQKTTVRYKGPIHGMKLIYLEEGVVRGLYGGLAAHLLRVVPNAGFLFLGYEAVLKYSDR